MNTPTPPEPELATAAADEIDGLARKFQKELNAGLISLVLLSILDRATEDLYGYQIAKRLLGLGEGNSPIKQGALYPVLRALSANGLLTSRVVPSYAGPPRRYYQITPAGRTEYRRWLSSWQTTRAFVDAITDPSHGAAEPSAQATE